VQAALGLNRGWSNAKTSAPLCGKGRWFLFVAALASSPPIATKLIMPIEFNVAKSYNLAMIFN